MDTDLHPLRSCFPTTCPTHSRTDESQASPSLTATLQPPVYDSSIEDRAEIADLLNLIEEATGAPVTISVSLSPESTRFKGSYDVSGSADIHEEQIELSLPYTSATIPADETHRSCENSDEVLLATSDDVNADRGNAQGTARAGGSLTDEIMVSSGPVVQAGGRALVHTDSRVQGRLVLTADEMAMASDVLGRQIVSLSFGEQPPVTLQVFIRWSASVTLVMSRATPTSARGATPSCSAMVVYSGNSAPHSNARATDAIVAMTVNATGRPAFAAVSLAILNGNLSNLLAIRARAGASSSVSAPPAAVSAAVVRPGILITGGSRSRNRTASLARGSRRRVTFNVGSHGGDNANVVDAPVRGRMLWNAAFPSASQDMVRTVPVLSSWLGRVGSCINAAAAAVVAAATGQVESAGERSRRVVEGSGTASFEQDCVLPEPGGRRAGGVPHRAFLLPR